MTPRKKKNWLIGIGLFAIVAVVALVVAGRLLAAHFEPYIRDQAIQYLEKRFDSDVELTELQVYLPHVSPFKLALNRGRGAMARIEGEGVSLRHRRERNALPLFVIKRFTFEVDL